MKMILGLLSLFTVLEVRTAEIRVERMRRDRELERSYVLSTNLPEIVVLDCQSFIQGLRIGEYESAYTFLLDPEECEGLQKRVRTSLLNRRHHCIDVEDDIRSDHSCY